VQQFYHATEIGNVANAVSACADQPLQIKTIVSDKVNYRGTQSKTCVVGERSAKSGEMVSGCRRQLRFPPKSNYYFLTHLQCCLKLHANSFRGVCSKWTNQQAKAIENN